MKAYELITEIFDLKPFEKNFYNSTSASRNMDQRLVEQFRY